MSFVKQCLGTYSHVKAYLLLSYQLFSARTVAKYTYNSHYTLSSKHLYMCAYTYLPHDTHKLHNHILRIRIYAIRLFYAHIEHNFLYQRQQIKKPLNNDG